MPLCDAMLVRACMQSKDARMGMLKARLINRNRGRLTLPNVKCLFILVKLITHLAVTSYFDSNCLV
jgi:hypothetical protein